MIITINKSLNPYNGLNIHLRGFQLTGLTKHKMGLSYSDPDLLHADLIILGNYVAEEVYQIINNLNNKPKIGYLFCSPFGQAFTNGELPILRDLIRLLDFKDNRLEFLFCGDVNLVRVLNHKRIQHLPAVSDFEGVFTPYPKRKGILFIGDNLRPHRNFANQLAAIKYGQIKSKLSEPIISYNMPNEAYEFFQDIFHIENWTNHTKSITEEEKKNIVSGSKLGMQITYSDGFNIAAYESAMCHVPCMVGESLPWGPREVKISRVDDPICIWDRMNNVLQTDHLIGDLFRESARNEMKKRLEICDEVLRKCL